MIKIHSFATAKRILFGAGSVGKIGAEAKSLNATKALIVTDSMMVKLSLIDKVTKPLESEKIAYEIWSGVEPEPSVEIAQGAVERAREGKFNLIIGIGGGSVLDTTKAAAMIAKQPGSVKDYLGATLPKPEIPFIQVPTTAGTGSEVSNLTILTVKEEEFKYAIYSPFLYPDVAIVDPVMSSTMPAQVTANTGVDALTHAIEAYVSLDASPITDIFAVEAIKLINQHLRVVYVNGDNLDARQGMAKASLFAGMAFGNAGTVLGHAAGYAHAHIHHLPHGASVAVSEPYVLQYNAIANLERHAHIAKLLGESIVELPLRDAALKAGVTFKKLLEDLDMPTSLKEVGVEKEQIPEIAKRVFKSRGHVARNPRKINLEDMIKLLKKAYVGILD